MKKSMKIILISTLIGVSVLTACASAQNKNNSSAATPSRIDETNASAPAFQIGNTVVKVGETKLDEIIKAGAVLDDSTSVKSFDDMISAGTESFIDVTVDDVTLKLTVENTSSEEIAYRDAVIKEAYTDKGSVYGIGGVKLGDTADEMIEKIGEPYQIIEGSDISESYGDIKAYCYSSFLDEKNVTFFVEKDGNTVISFEEKEPLNYLTDINQLSDEQLNALIKERTDNTDDYIGKYPYIVDVDHSDYAVSELADVKYTNAKLFTLKNVKDVDTFNKDVTDIDSSVAKSYLVVEFEAKINYSEEERKYADFVGIQLDESYNVHGCFCIINPYLDENGKIGSDISANVIRNLDGVYTSVEHMYEDIFIGQNQGYSFDDYAVSEKNIVTENEKEEKK